ncbi:hypothetical protein CDD81_967 [Ophiocordyceps australis]|uniref:Uncharacterized protein n=1 Tax=Ophiocordyceps australis TaxID=1399860 RepID=A0A2C5Y296_9HYPO|nr:hypothetical protein CDD81_967 [Ophiocordyceps australis]
MPRLTSRERDEIGGVEYQALKLLLKVITAYFFGMQLLGALGLLVWIHLANAKYTILLDSVHQDKTWWAFYTSQSLMDNLGFTLTPDNMVPFCDTIWPLLLLSFVALAGETLYPVFLRCVIWAMARLVPHTSPQRLALAYLLDHPRRCYTLLFPSGTTWALFAIIGALNVIDTVLIVVLDLHNAEVAHLKLVNRFVSAFFQAVASRHAGTTPYNLDKVSPAVQFSLLVMMYISIYPVAMSIRTSSTYEQGSVGVWACQEAYDEQTASTYLVQHIQQQLGFDLWYIFLGIFLLAVTEGPSVADLNDSVKLTIRRLWLRVNPSFQHMKIFPIFFEVVSAYANVGISLGHPSVNSALSTKFSVAGKLVVCAMMIRGRHRGMPHGLDRAIMLPDEHLVLESRRES